MDRFSCNQKYVCQQRMFDSIVISPSFIPFPNGNIYEVQCMQCVQSLPVCLHASLLSIKYNIWPYIIPGCKIPKTAIKIYPLQSQQCTPDAEQTVESISCKMKCIWSAATAIPSVELFGTNRGIHKFADPSNPYKHVFLCPTMNISSISIL